MIFYVFDMSIVDPDQVREVLTSMAKSGLVGGIYLWLNKSRGKMYVGSTLNFKRRMKTYFGLTQVHGIIGKALLKYGFVTFTLILVFVPNATKELVLSLEQSVLDNCVCAYNIAPNAGSTAGVKRSEETKEKVRQNNLARGWKGKLHPYYNSGKPVYLLQVLPTGFKLAATFPNISRCSEALSIPRGSMWRYINKKKLFTYNGTPHLLSYDLPQNL